MIGCFLTWLRMRVKTHAAAGGGGGGPIDTPPQPRAEQFRRTLSAALRELMVHMQYKMTETAAMREIWRGHSARSNPSHAARRAGRRVGVGEGGECAARAPAAPLCTRLPTSPHLGSFRAGAYPLLSTTFGVRARERGRAPRAPLESEARGRRAGERLRLGLHLRAPPLTDPPLAPPPPHTRTHTHTHIRPPIDAADRAQESQVSTELSQPWRFRRRSRMCT